MPNSPVRAAAIGRRARVFAALALLAFAAGGPRALEAAEPEVRVAPPGTIVRSEVGRLAWTAFDERSGLPANTVVFLALGPDGRLWAGTQEGAASYDGNGWKALPMPRELGSAYVRSLLPARDGSLWFGTFDGGIAHRFEDGEWELFTDDTGLPSNRIRALLEPREAALAGLWAATDQGVARLLSGRWTVFDASSGLPSDQADALLEVPGDSGSALLVGTDDGIGRFENGRWTRVEVPAALVGYRILGLAQTDGVLWVSSYGAGLAKLEGDEWTLFDTTSGLPSNASANLVAGRSPDGSPTLWVGLEGGVVRYQGGRFQLLDHHSGMPGEIVWSVFETPPALGPQQLWVGSYGGGVFRLDRGGWLSFDQREGLPLGVVLAFAEAPGPGGAPELWAGTAEGTLARLTQSGWVEVELPATFRNLSVTSMLASRGPDGADELWITSQGGGVGVLSNGRWTVYRHEDGVPHDRVDHVLEIRDEDGRRELWFATEGGLGRLDRDGWTTMKREDGLPADWTTRLLVARDSEGRPTLWVGTAGAGIARWDGESFRAYGRDDGLESEAVWSLREVTDASGARWLWAGTWGGGASRIRLDVPAERFETFSDTTEPALPSRTVNHIEQDAEGRVYLFTTGGAVRLTPREEAPGEALGGAPFEAYTFTTEDGLPSNDCQAGAGLVDHRGRVWVGTARGVGMYDATLEAVDRAPKPLIIERAVLSGEGSKVTDGTVLAHTQRNLTFDFALLSYSRESKSRFRAQLVGFDPEPSEWSTHRSKEYTNLEPGDYEFRVWGRDYALNTTGPVSLAFTIRPAPWSTPVAYAAYLGLVGLLAWGGVRVRLRAITRTNRQLEAKVAERTAELAASERRAQEASRAKSAFLASMSHELRTPLNAVLGFAQIMSRRQPRDEEDRRHLAVIQSSGEHLLGLIDEVLSLSRIEAGRVELSREPFDLAVLVDDVLGLLEPRAQSKGIGLHDELAPELPARVLGDAGKLRQILLNLLGNAVKFTAEGSVTLRVSWSQGQAIFEVEDTGAGIAASELAGIFEPFVQAESGQQLGRGAGLGLAVSRELARRMGGDLTATSEPGHGSMFRLEVSLPVATEAAEATESTPAGGRSRVSRVAPGQPDWRVLVVDNVETNRTLLSELLASVGHSVREAEGGEQAVEEWRRWRPHLIFMDRRMAKVDGAEAMRRIRSEAGDEGRVVVVAHSASALAHERGELLEAGFDDFLAKPFREESLFALMSRHLGVRYELSAAPPVPVADADSGPREGLPHERPEPGARSLPAARVLLVDDQPINRQLARYLLEQLGLTVSEAADGHEALACLAQEEIDLVLLDIEMPGMDGFQVLHAIRSDPRTRALPVLALTAHSEPELEQRLRAAGMSDHVAKPIDPDSLRAALAKWLAPASERRAGEPPVPRVGPSSPTRRP